MNTLIVSPVSCDIDRTLIREPQANVLRRKFHWRIGDDLVLSLYIDSCEGIYQVGLNSQYVETIGGNPCSTFQSGKVDRPLHMNCRKCLVGIIALYKMHLPRWRMREISQSFAPEFEISDMTLVEDQCEYRPTRIDNR